MEWPCSAISINSVAQGQPQLSIANETRTNLCCLCRNWLVLCLLKYYHPGWCEPILHCCTHVTPSYLFFLLHVLTYMHAHVYMHTHAHAHTRMNMHTQMDNQCTLLPGDHKVSWEQSCPWLRPASVPPWFVLLVQSYSSLLQQYIHLGMASLGLWVRVCNAVIAYGV